LYFRAKVKILRVFFYFSTLIPTINFSVYNNINYFSTFAVISDKVLMRYIVISITTFYEK